jgi:hypothetical protein
VAFIQVANRPQLRPAYSGGGGGGSLVNGGTATISGSGFGTKSATVVSFKPLVEAASTSTAIYDIASLSSSGWANCNGTEAGSGVRRTQVTTTRPCFGTKSLECANVAATGHDGRFGVSWDTGATITDLFVRDYVYITNTGGQWKMERLASQECLTDDASVNCYASNQEGYSFDFFHTQKGNGCGAGGATQVWGDPGTDYNTTSGIWYERERRFKPSTSAAATDGIFNYKFRRTTDWVEVSVTNFTNVEYYDTGEANRNRYYVLQNYLNNGAFDSQDVSVFMDGTWISNGDIKRVYLSTGATWAAVNATNGIQRELQYIQSWTDTLITITVQQGLLSTLTGLYAYVVDASGNVNANGYTVTPA